MKLLFLLIAFFLFSSCGYRNVVKNEVQTISVPYVGGDSSGSFTSLLSNTIAASSLFKYVTNSGEYELIVSLCGVQAETIGYQREFGNAGNVEKKTIPNESRMVGSANVSIYKRGEKILGPFNVDAFIDFDYVDPNARRELQFTDTNSQQVPALSFSLGQFESKGNAEQGAHQALYQILAEKIVDLIYSQW